MKRYSGAIAAFLLLAAGAASPAMAQVSALIFVPMSGQSFAAGEYQSETCRGRANGLYCGAGSTRQQKFQCDNGALTAQWPCPGDCASNTLDCKPPAGGKPVNSSASGTTKK